MAIDFFKQFLLSPSNIDASSAPGITKFIEEVANQYHQVAANRGVDARRLAFGRPLYLLVAEATDGLCVTYTNENAVRGTTQWWYLDVRGQGLVQLASKEVIQIAERDIGLGQWKSFFVPRELLAESDATILASTAKTIAIQVFQGDLEDDLQRRRLVQFNPIFTGRRFCIEPDNCFVLMPFRDELRPIMTTTSRRW
jgi:hypothetical protein